MRKVANILTPLIMCVMIVVLFVNPVQAAYLDFNWDFSSPKEEEYDSWVEKGYKEVSLEEAEKLGREYYNNRNRDSGELKIFCEGALSGELETLYTSPVNCYDSYDEASVRSFIKYNKGAYYSAYSFGIEFSNFRQENMTDIQYNMAMDKAMQLAEQFNYGTTKEKIERTYNWVCDNMEYDDTLTKGSIYDAFILGDTVCTGYATSFQVIMEAMDIESYLCTGYVDGDNHAWNAVNVDGVYYFVDPTFGDTSGNLDKWLFFGTDRRTNETSLNITSASDYSDADEAVCFIIGLLVIIVPIVLVVIIIVVICVVVSSNRKKNAHGQTYVDNTYGNVYGNTYGGPQPGMPYNSASQYNQGTYNSGQYGAGQYGASQYGTGQYNHGQYGGQQYTSPQYSFGQYGSQQYNAGQYGSGQYANTQYGTNQYGNQYGGQYGGSQYGMGQYRSAQNISTQSQTNDSSDMNYVNPYMDKLDTVDMNYANPYLNQDTSNPVNLTKDENSSDSSNLN